MKTGEEKNLHAEDRHNEKDIMSHTDRLADRHTDIQTYREGRRIDNQK